MNTVLDYAIFYHNNKLSIIPIIYKDKKPAIAWKEYQNKHPTLEEIKKWFSESQRNIAIVCGQVSGNLMVLDFDSNEMFQEFLIDIAEHEDLINAIKNTWVVETGKGIHIYFRCPEPPVTKSFRDLKIDIRGEGSYVLAPPSVHPSGKQYKFKTDPKKTDIYVLSQLEYEKLLKVLEDKCKKLQPQIDVKLHKLTEEQKEKIVSLLLPFWTEGRRHHLALMLAGLLYWHGYPVEDALAVVSEICRRAKDEEMDDRIRAVEDTFKRAGDKNIAYKHWLQEAGFRGEQFEQLVSKLLEIIKGSFVIGNGKLVIRKNYNTLILCDFNKCIIKELKIRKEELILSDIIATAVPSEVVVIQTEEGELLKVKFKTPDGYTFVLEGDVSEISSFMKRTVRVTSRTKFEDAFSLIISKMLQIGWCNVVRGDQVKGVLLNNNNEIITIDYDINYTTDELKEALQLLNNFVKLSEFNKDRVAKVSKIIKWFVVAGFSWVFKQLNKWQPHLYLYGESDTGKTATARFLINIWEEQPMLSLGSIDSPFRLGLVLSKSTFPVIVNEMDFDSLDTEVIELWKNAVDSKIVRSRYGRQIKAYNVLCFTSNTSIPSNRAIQKRLVIIHFDPQDSEILVKQKEKFEELNRKRAILRAIGKFAVNLVKNRPELLQLEWEELSEKILIEAFNSVGLQPPYWIKLRESENNHEDIKLSKAEEIRSILKEECLKYCGKYLDKYYSKVDASFLCVELSLRVPFTEYHRGDNKVLILSPFVKILKKNGVNISGLKDLTYYIPKSEYKRGIWVNGRSVSAVVCDPVAFVEWLGYLEEEEMKESKDEKKEVEEIEDYSFDMSEWY